MKKPLEVASAFLIFAILFEGRCLGYEKKPLDDRPEAVGEGEGMVRLIRESQFRELRSSFDGKRFSKWSALLSQVEPGATIEDVMKTLSLKERPAAIGLGVGLIYNFTLDDSYMVSGLFSYDGRLKQISKNPIAIIYQVYGDDEPIGQPTLPE